MSYSPPTARDRILDAARELFYAEGIRAISADKVIERAGITKVTFYRHFPTKDLLVEAYLRRHAAWEQAHLDGMRADADSPAQVLHGFARWIGYEACQPGFRGCAFINAAAEYAEPGSPVRAIITEHRAWYHRMFASVLEELGVPGADQAAEELMMLRDGAMLAGYLSEPAKIADALDAAIFAVVESRRRPAES